MHIIRHRINTRALLERIPSGVGVEIDLRSRNDELILEHEPYKDGETFVDWLEAWNGQLIVLNIKEEGLEQSILNALSQRNIENYFFLDQSFPFMQKLIRSGNRRAASRASDVESVETALVSGTEWCWLDSFSGNWEYLAKAVPLLRNHDIRTCLVSPELQRNDSRKELTGLKNFINDQELHIEAVCTKTPEEWK